MRRPYFTSFSGGIALKAGKTAAIRASAFACALLIYGYIVSVARSRDPLRALYVFVS